MPSACFCWVLCTGIVLGTLGSSVEYTSHPVLSLWHPGHFCRDWKAGLMRHVVLNCCSFCLSIFPPSFLQIAGQERVSVSRGNHLETQQYCSSKWPSSGCLKAGTKGYFFLSAFLWALRFCSSQVKGAGPGMRVGDEDTWSWEWRTIFVCLKGAIKEHMLP